jgi:hypothetical protein
MTTTNDTAYEYYQDGIMHGIRDIGAALLSVADAILEAASEAAPPMRAWLLLPAGSHLTRLDDDTLAWGRGTDVVAMLPPLGGDDYHVRVLSDAGVTFTLSERLCLVLGGGPA